MAAATNPSASPPPPAWTPLPPTSSRGGMLNLHVSSLAFWARALGFLLLFVGTLVAVAFASLPGGCFASPPNCGTGFASGAANAVLSARVLWTLGLFFVGAGAGFKLHWALSRSSSASSDEVRVLIHDRWFNGLLVILTIVLLWFLLSGAGTFLPNSLP